MEYEETYYGQRVIVTTLQRPDGGWVARAELLDSGGRRPIVESSDDAYPSEEAAREAAFSVAVSVVDRGRISRGKP